MARRSEDWNVGLAKDLRDAAFARQFLLASIDEGVDLQLALGKVIRAMGVSGQGRYGKPWGDQPAITRRRTRLNGLLKPVAPGSAPR